ncbi:phage major capsid protein [Micromonospora sp. D93]|uniref:phage major capsid protein n=1 Tax=Micromonospora sp. D93 TaxID=2824886 RepID=UPI001B36FC5F|nr:phage major capsid protein [Micromonospora sp. D93]MBQ1017752.1 phage major capsid protein [Micromonospora sp. D93]
MDKDQIKIRQRAIADEMKALLDEAKDGQFTDEQDARFKALDEETRDNETRLETIEARAEVDRRFQRFEESRKKWGSVQTGAPKVDPFDIDVRRADSQTVLSRARGLIGDEQGAATRHMSPEQRAQVDQLLTTNNGDTDGTELARRMLVTSRSEYLSAFQKGILGRDNRLTPDEIRALNDADDLFGNQERRALAIGAGGTGGFAVPVIVDPTIILTAQESPNDIMRLARTETITTDRWKGLSSAGMSWKWDAEAAASADNSPTIASPEVLTKRADGFIPYSIEAEMDWPSFATEMGNLIEEGYSELLASTLTTGTGANVPTGIVPAIIAAGGLTRQVATSAVLAPGDFYGLWADLPIKWRRRATVAWMSSTSVENAMRQFGTTDPNFTVNIKDAQVPALFNREYVENDFMAAMPSGVSTAVLAVVGDWKQYLVAQRAGMWVERVQMLFDPTNNRPTGQRGFAAYARVGAGLIVPAAFRALINK